MKPFFQFLVRHWFTLALLGAAIFGVMWVVRTQRTPGSMTVIEAQAMDMTTSSAPEGALPVEIATATSREVGSSESFPAVVAAFGEEEIGARVPGIVKSLRVYPGDHVKPGQVLGTIDANEYAAQASEGRLMASSKLAAATTALREASATRTMIERAQAERRRALAAVQRSEAERSAMQAERDQASSDLAMSQADLREKQADLTYADQSLARDKTLFSKGAISLDDLQASQKDRDMAAARVEAATNGVSSKVGAVRVADKKVLASEKMVAESQAMVSTTESEIKQARANLAKAEADAKAAGLEAASAGEGAKGLATMADYRTLRSLTGGIVSERLASPGTNVMMGQVILKVRSLGQVRVQAELPQKMLGHVAKGTPVMIIVDSLTRQAEVTSVFPTVSERSRTFRIEAIVENGDGVFAPGMFAKMSVGLSKATLALSVPSEAVRSGRDGGSFVWLMTERQGDGEPTDWTCTMHPEVSRPAPGKCPLCRMDLVPRTRTGKFVAEKRAVTPGATNGRFTLIRDGLAEGDKVILSGLENLQPGTPVSATPLSAKEPAMPGMSGDAR